jgi:protein TonB
VSRMPLLPALLTAVFLHLVGLAVAALFWEALGVSPLPSHPVAVEVVAIAPPPEPVVPPPAESPPVAPAPVTPDTPPTPIPPPPVVERTERQHAAPRPKPLPSTPPARVKKPASPPAGARLPGPPAVARTPAEQAPQPGPPLPAERPQVAGNAVGGKSQETPQTPVEGGEAGAGKLFAHGNVPVVPGPGTNGGSGGPGDAGLGFGERGRGAQGGGVRPGAGGAELGGEGVEVAARPLGGGYQVKPRYPDSARREGIEGTVLLKTRVTERGLVETVQVERSAGHPDLDQAAVEAVRRWRFEPARRSGEPVAVWVRIPVQYKLER